MKVRPAVQQGGTGVPAAGRRRLLCDSRLRFSWTDVANYCFPTTWPTDRERRARYIGEWPKTEARYLA